MYTTDPRLAAIYRTGRCEGVPPEIAQAAHWLLEMIRHVREWSTLHAIADISLGPADRHFAAIGQDWAISFEWDYDRCGIKNPILEGGGQIPSFFEGSAV